MRTRQEILFRVRQEASNLRLWLAPPRAPAPPLELPTGLPAPGPIVEKLRGSRFERDIELLANAVLAHEFPIPGTVLRTGDRVEWRRDYRSGITSDLRYFRLVPYLDFSRVGDHKVVWDLNRHQHLVALAQAFRFSRRTEYLRELEIQLDSWFTDNLFMRGINWTSALEVAFRSLSWIWIYHLVGAELSTDVRDRLTENLFRHGCYLERNLSVYFAPNTHLLGEVVALHALGTIFSSFPYADRWRRVGGQMVLLQLDAQIRDDGSHFEQSSYYHVYALDMFLFHAVIAGVTEPLRSKLRKMAEYLARLMGPSRTLPLIGDDDGGRLFHPYGRCDRFARATLATTSLVVGEPSWPFDEHDLHEQAAWWLGAQVLGRKTSNRDPGRSALCETSGTAVLQTGATHVIVDAGPFGSANAGHSHSDTLSVIISHGDEELLIDPGTYTYVGDASLRNWFRGTAAHNTVRVDGIDQAVPAGPFRWVDVPDVELLYWGTGPDVDVIDAVCRARRVAHRRSVSLLKPVDEANGAVIVVHDVVDGPSGLHEIEQFWHPAAVIVQHHANCVEIGAGHHLLVPEGSSFTLSRGWRSHVFGEKEPAPVLIVRRQTELPAHLWAVILVNRAPATVTMRLLGGHARRAIVDVDGVAREFGSESA